MIDNGPQACYVKDKKGFLPAHVACSRHCSIDKLRLLLQVNRQALFEKTLDGDTLLDLAMKNSTRSHPNVSLKQELKRWLQTMDQERGPNKKRKQTERNIQRNDKHAKKRNVQMIQSVNAPDCSPKAKLDDNGPNPTKRLQTTDPKNACDNPVTETEGVAAMDLTLRNFGFVDKIVPV